MMYDDYFQKEICKMYGNGNEFVTMGFIAREFDLSKYDVIQIIHNCIQNNIISDELTERIVSKVLRKSLYSHEVKKAYDQSLRIRKINLKENSKYQRLKSQIEYYEHILSIYDSDYSDADCFYKNNTYLSKKVDKLKDDLNLLEYYSTLPVEEFENLVAN